MNPWWSVSSPKLLLLGPCPAVPLPLMRIAVVPIAMARLALSRVSPGGRSSKTRMRIMILAILAITVPLVPLGICQVGPPQGQVLFRLVFPFIAVAAAVSKLRILMRMSQESRQWNWAEHGRAHDLLRRQLRMGRRPRLV